MPEIRVLDRNTIDQIAAGEVIERPSSVVKELVENAIDAGADIISIEIKDGGTSFIRVADNGCGIEPTQVPTAFLPHATSKIRSADDLLGVPSLGFRGEALPSIASVSMTEMITKAKDALTGTRYVIEGGRESVIEDTAAPDGTIFIVRNLFYNTPARRKFMKSPMTEASYITELVGRLALSHPDISFDFINNAQPKLHTSGNGSLKDVIYQIYGRDVAANLSEISEGTDGLSIKGYIGKPVISRGNRSFENYFINGRYIKSSFIARGIEEGYRTFMMQHRYPFTVLHLEMDGSLIDVNVHPAKMELRFSNQEQIYSFVRDSVRKGLKDRELIPNVTLDGTEEGKHKSAKNDVRVNTADPKAELTDEEKAEGLDFFMREMRKRVSAEFEESANAGRDGENHPAADTGHEENAVSGSSTAKLYEAPPSAPGVVREDGEYGFSQQDLFENRLLDPARKADIRIIGQLFDTYWLVEYDDKFYMIDQHAAHEKVLYERTVKALSSKEIDSQYISPPIILTLTQKEASLLESHMGEFAEMGFEIGHFGGNEFALSAVPANLFGLASRDIFIEMLDSLEYVNGRDTGIILDKVASMSCKAAVKGHTALSEAEARALIEELLGLENPYTCPHGRPTIISMTRRDIEKKFKRVV